MRKSGGWAEVLRVVERERRHCVRKWTAAAGCGDRCIMLQVRETRGCDIVNNGSGFRVFVCCHRRSAGCWVG
jgi:hypothetical protein